MRNNRIEIREFLASYFYIKFDEAIEMVTSNPDLIENEFEEKLKSI